jgi:TPR repeat protein
MAYSDMEAPDTLAVESPDVGLHRNSPAGELYRAGLAFSTGLGCEIDLVAAHKWFNIAAMAGSEEAKQARRDMAAMLSSGEIAQALRSAREWMALAN